MPASAVPDSVVATTDRAWRLGWWSPVAPGPDPSELIDPAIHGPLLAATAEGDPLDPVGRGRLAGLRAAGLVAADWRPRFPVAPAAQATRVRETASGLGAAIARLLAGEWSRINVEHEPLRSVVPDRTASTAGFLVVGGLLLDLGVRRLLRREGLMAPPFGSSFVWLAEGDEGAAGRWFARVSVLPGRGRLIRYGQPDTPAWSAAGAEPEAAPAIPTAREPELNQLIDGLAGPVARLVTDAHPTLLRVRPLPEGEDPGAYLAWAYTLAADAALAQLAGRGLVAYPTSGVVAARVADPELAPAG